ncbi:MAG: DNA polymerase I [Roseiflexaceae bacterium]|nr:DNA polymerase I [Roseiflexaceae bacterium]
MSDRPTILVIDGHALAFRAFHALREAGLRASTGEPTYAVFGFLSIMLNAIDERHPEYLAVSFDIGRTFRDDMYAEYKAGRTETPAEFHPQLDRIQQVIRALNIPIYTAEGFEADDVIGTIARQASAQDVATIILTGDTDTLQLVDDHVQVLLANPYAKGGKNTTLYDHAAVVERYKGLQPDQLADLRGLKGDTSDNIPGVKGIGEAGAIALLLQFGTVEALYDQFDQVPNRYKKPLDGQRETALFSKKLATIVCDAPATLDLPHARLGDYDRAHVIALFQEMEMGATLIKKLPHSGQAAETVELPEATPTPAPLPAAVPAAQDSVFSLPDSLPVQEEIGGPQQLALFELGAAGTGRAAPLVNIAVAAVEPNTALGNYRAITTEDALIDLVTELAAAPAFAFDTETDGLRPFDSQLVGVSVATRPGSAVYIPFGHTTDDAQLDATRVLNALRPFLSDPHKPKYAHNAKFDIEVLLHAGVLVEGLTFDTMLAAALLDKRKGLKDLAFYELRLPEPMTAIEELIGKGKHQVTFAQVPLATATPYAAADADMTLRLVEALRPQLEALPKVNDIFMRLEMPLLPVLVRMEAAGIAIDVAYMRALGQRLGTRLGELEQQIYVYNGGMPFNIGSGQQLTELLFTKLGLDPSGLEKTKTGQYSLTAQAMELLRDRHPEEAGYQIIDLILQHRQLTKLKSTYIDALPELVDKDDGRIHTSYSQLGAATGRLSSNDPNLQNIPTRTDEGREIRRGFTAKPGHQFVAADYSQIELRVLAHITNDENLVATFNEGRDIHATMASQLFNVPQEKVDKNQRRVAKTVIFGVVYGISSFGLAPRIGASRSEAQAMIDALFARFPKIRAYIDQTLADGRQNGYVQSLFGRRRTMAELKTGGPRRQAAEREAINAPIQATAADIMKIAMIRVDEALRREGLQTRLLLQVHDELILEAPDHEVSQAAALVKREMEGAFALRVPLGVDVEAGPNWLEMKDVG